jgi:hypothetical protein
MERTRYTSPNTIPNDRTYPDILHTEKPMAQEILVPIASTPGTNRPLAAANSNSKGGNSGGTSACQVKDRVGSSDENDDEDESEDKDEDDPLVVIDKSKKSSSTLELAGLDGNLGCEWEAPAGSLRRKSRTVYRHRPSARLVTESAEAS